MRTGGETRGRVGLLGILIGVIIALVLLWFIYGGRTSSTSTRKLGTGIELQPPPTTPITPRSTK